MDAVRASGVASVVFFTLRFQPATSTWLAQAGRTTLAGGAGSWLGSLAGSPFDDSPWRKEHGALWDLGPHALSLLVPALGPVVSVQAGAGLQDTVHLVLTHDSGAASTVSLSSTVSPMSGGTEFFVHGDAGRLVLLPGEESAVDSFGVAVDELTAAALTAVRIRATSRSAASGGRARGGAAGARIRLPGARGRLTRASLLDRFSRSRSSAGP